MELEYYGKRLGGDLLDFYFLGYPFVCGRRALVHGCDEINYVLVRFATDLRLILPIGLVVHRILSFAISEGIVSIRGSACRRRDALYGIGSRVGPCPPLFLNSWNTSESAYPHF